VRHRKPDGFVILPDAFSDGRLSRDAWRTVKACLGAVRAEQRPSAFRIRAVCLDDDARRTSGPAAEVPIRATWVEVWRTIHRVRRVEAFRRSSGRALCDELGVSVEPVRRPGEESRRD